MGEIRFSDRRVLNLVGSLGLLVGMILPAVIPSFASAAQITSRSVQMSSSAVSATGVKYTVQFTPVSNAAGFVIDFCDNTPLVGQSCTAPAGMSMSGVGTSTGGATVAALTTSGDTGAAVTYALTGGTQATVELTGITNPNYLTANGASNGLYARIVTYATGTDIAATDTNTTPAGSATDNGGVALSTTSAFQVSGSVLETMTFCVSGTDTSVSGNPHCSGTLTTPNLNLGTQQGTTYVLSNNSASPSTGTVYTQLSTNAVNGAIVNLHSDASLCGGLRNVENSSDCIPAAPSGGIAAGAAGFGMETGAASATATTGDAGASGAIDPASGYSTSNFYMNFTSGASPTTGVTSPYGSPILNSNSSPVNDMNMPLVFGAAANNNTPAGNYSATLNLIATGTF